MPPALHVLLGGFLQLWLLANILSAIIVMPSASLVAVMGIRAGSISTAAVGFAVAFTQAMALLLPAMHMQAHP
ncbi:hypothetical protein HY634_00715 [Candidatus Uhrbacteria bacterium]|nr:hypothetical protein [Candidatus Uhrbacteria bacterium]